MDVCTILYQLWCTQWLFKSSSMDHQYAYTCSSILQHKHYQLHPLIIIIIFFFMYLKNNTFYFPVHGRKRGQNNDNQLTFFYQFTCLLKPYRQNLRADAYFTHCPLNRETRSFKHSNVPVTQVIQLNVSFETNLINNF